VLLFWEPAETSGNQLGGAKMRKLLCAVMLCGIGFHVAMAQKAFERVDKFPDGLQGSLVGSLTSVTDTKTVSVTLKVPYDATWSAVKAVAQKFDKLGKRPIVAINEASGRIQNGKIQVESMILSGSLMDFKDEFVTEVTVVDSITSQLSVTRKVVKKQQGKWVGYSSNGKIERWFITQVLDEIKTPTAGVPSVPASSNGMTRPAVAGQETRGIVFISQENPRDILELRDDKSFRLVQKGQQAFGQYELSGETLTLIAGKQRSSGHLVGDTLTDPENKLWTRQSQSGPSAAQASGAAPALAAQSRSVEVIGNAEIIKLVQAKLPEAVILGRIKSSACKFDLSTDALIKLKEAGVSDAIIQAMADSPQK
jgi:hypothetical protein